MSKTLWALGQCMGAPQYFNKLFNKTKIIHSPEELVPIKEGDVIMYGGGEDISPSLYKQKHYFGTQYNAAKSRRDAFEEAAFYMGQKEGATHFGICRGAQLLCALGGGRLVQHVNGHVGNHAILTYDGRKFVTSSAHHQMMYPWDIDHSVIASAERNRSTVYVMNDKETLDDLKHPEPEIVFFSKINALGIQGHPEFMSYDHPFVNYSRELVEEYLL